MVRRKNKLLLAKRPAAGLYGGLWELPQADDRADLLESFPGLTLSSSRAHVREQELSHRRLRIEVFHGTLPRKPRRAGDYLELRWQPLTSLASLGVSSATRAIVVALTDEEKDDDGKQPTNR